MRVDTAHAGPAAPWRGQNPRPDALDLCGTTGVLPVAARGTALALPVLMMAVCTQCQVVAVHAPWGGCPLCGGALIQSLQPTAIMKADVDKLFRLGASLLPLPGVSPEPRQAQLMAMKRRERIRQKQLSEKLQEKRNRRRRRLRLVVGEICAASAVVVLLLMLRVFGAL
ncbi:MAG: hypothetical protein HY698_15890 [Deltaproteobacteria bacterium]|nr:hypothetical protein [Deltaproteobacteria bacterium]